VNQIKKNSANVAHAVDQITRAMLIKEPSSEEIMDAFVSKMKNDVDFRNFLIPCPSIA
jgi:hypothetical protein